LRIEQRNQRPCPLDLDLQLVVLPECCLVDPQLHLRDEGSSPSTLDPRSLPSLNYGHNIMNQTTAPRIEATDPSALSDPAVQQEIAQISQALEANPLWGYKPHPKQYAFHAAKTRLRCYFGGKPLREDSGGRHRRHHPMHRQRIGAGSPETLQAPGTSGARPHRSPGLRPPPASHRGDLAALVP